MPKNCFFCLNNFRFVPDSQKFSLEGSNSTVDFKSYYENLAKYLTEVSWNLKVLSLAGKLLQLLPVALTRLSNLPNLKNVSQNHLCSLISKICFYGAVLFFVILQEMLHLYSTVIGSTTGANYINRQAMVFIIVVTESL